ncbi:MAG: hypothetical protein FWD77_00605 [Betaproteobacteria bacterium]|nr:hypothetical protein [Betaproteobacteria bacterium]
MEKWITRFCAALCAGGGLGLFWVAGVVSTLLLQGASPAPQAGNPASGGEMKILAVAILSGAAVSWASLHMLALADRQNSPRFYRAARLAYFILVAATVAFGASWASGRFVPG